MGARSGVRAMEAADHLQQLRLPGYQHAGAGEGARALSKESIRFFFELTLHRLPYVNESVQLTGHK